MEEKIEVGKKSPRKKSQKNRAKVVYPYELRLKAVKLQLEDGISREVIGRELGASEGSVSNWVKAYQQQGEDGLRNKPCGAPRGRKKLPEPVTARIVELKKAEPSWGVKRIAQVLRRMFWLPGSPETVRTRLHEAGLMNNERAKGRRNLTRPRFFERPRRISSGKPTSSPSGWEGSTPTSLRSSMITPVTWWGRTCFAVPRQRR